jgi:DNA repair photolyase
MDQRPGPLRGRGAHDNPRNRFYQRSVEADPEAFDPEEPLPRTEFLKDISRTIIATNESPDIPFEASINPYRGCEHGCVYCMSGDTRILLADGTTRPLVEIRRGDWIVGTERDRGRRACTLTRVEDCWRVRRRAFQILLEDGTELTAGADHRFLTRGGWKFVAAGADDEPRPVLSRGDRLLGVRDLPREIPSSVRKDVRAHSGGTAVYESAAGTLSTALLGLEVTSPREWALRSVMPLAGVQELFDITTGTGDFIANGVVSHNCYARPFHEFLGFSAGLDFETKILVKEDAPELLRKELSKKGWTPKLLALSGVTDPYQPVERRLTLTRRCLEVLADFRNPVAIITKNHLVTRDSDVLRSMARLGAAAVSVSITTLDSRLARTMEPRTSTPERRLLAISHLARAGIPVGVNVAPIIPGLTDHEVPVILKAAAEAGASFAGHTVLRLPHGVKDLFATWLGEQLPDRKEKVLHRIREVRDGALNDPAFGSRMSGRGNYADQIHDLFRLGCRKAGLGQDPPELSTAHFRVPPGPQLELFP